MESKFIIEVFHKDRWGDMPLYISTLGSRPENVEFGGLYQARYFDTKSNAEKAASRVARYIDEAAIRGYSTYCYNYDDTYWSPVTGNWRGRMRSSDMVIRVREVQLAFID